MRRLLDRWGPALALVAVTLLFGILVWAKTGRPAFFSANNLETVARQTAIVGLAALGMTLVIIAGGIDLSAGSTIALTSVVVAALVRAGLSPLLSALAGLATASACGAANGLLVTRLSVVPFIITLGTMLVFRGAAGWIAGDQKIDAPMTWLTELISALPPGRRWMLFPPGVWLLAVLALGVAGLLRRTRLGRHVFAVGSSEAAARLCGVPVERVKLSVYLLGGLFAGLAGLLQFARLTVGDPTVAAGLELDMIAAVVIGGGSLLGGAGRVSGTLIGALVMTVIAMGCTQLGVANSKQKILTGIIIVVAVALDGLRQRRGR
jgi:ribose/xylose/arabinose/galactoside ABC-type transport system permease subunit